MTHTTRNPFTRVLTAGAAIAVATLVSHPSAASAHLVGEGSPHSVESAAADEQAAHATQAALPDGYVEVRRGSNDRAQESATAACMAEAGFQYRPVAYDFVEYAQVDGEGSPLPGSEVHPTIEQVAPLNNAQEQNWAYLEALSVTERVAYQRAMWGVNVNLDDQGHLGMSLGDAEGGCIDAT